MSQIIHDCYAPFLDIRDYYKTWTGQKRLVLTSSKSIKDFLFWVSLDPEAYHCSIVWRKML